MSTPDWSVKMMTVLCQGAGLAAHLLNTAVGIFQLFSQLPLFKVSLSLSLSVSLSLSLSLSLTHTHTHTTNLVVGRKNLMLLEKGQAFPQPLCFSLPPLESGHSQPCRTRGCRMSQLEWREYAVVFGARALELNQCLCQPRLCTSRLRQALEALSGSFSHPQFGPHRTEGRHKWDGTCRVFI